MLRPPSLQRHARAYGQSPLPVLNVCRIKYSRQHRPPAYAADILEHPYKTLHQQSKQKYQARSKDALWWSVSSNTLGKRTNSTVRHWSSRRLRVAFREALKLNGYDAEGKAIAGLCKAKVNLIGTLEILGQSALITAPFSQVKEETKWVLDIVVRKSRTQTIKVEERSDLLDEAASKEGHGRHQTINGSQKRPIVNDPGNRSSKRQSHP